MMTIADKRAILVDLLGGVCVSCGTVDRLQFDHVLPSEKLFSIGGAIESSLDKLVSELQKCQLLCVSCHKVKTRSDRGWLPKTHGTVSCYKNHGCRCVACRKANADYQRPIQAAYKTRLKMIYSKKKDGR